MTLQLDLLDTVIDRAEESDDIVRVPSHEELKDVNKILLKYIIKNKLIVYGGTALDVLLKYKSGEGIYGSNKIPDYDFISSNNVRDGMALANILVKNNYPYVAVNQAQHGNTVRVKVNFAQDPSADITYYPLDVFKHVPYEEINKVRYVSSEYIRIDFYKSFTNPNNFYRWLEKDEYMRYIKLLETYPLEDVKISYKAQLKSVTGRIREVFSLLFPTYQDDLIWTGIIAFNRFSKVMDTKAVPINYLEAYISNADKVAKDLVDTLGDKYKVVSFSALLDHYPSMSMIVYGKHPLLCLYDLSSTDFIKSVMLDNQMFVSYNRLLLFFHIKRLQSSIWEDKYYYELSYNLLFRLTNERENYLNKNNLIGIEKGEPLSIFDFDFNNMPMSEREEQSIKSYYGQGDRFRYYPDKKVEMPTIDYKFKKMDGLPL